MNSSFQGLLRKGRHLVLAALVGAGLNVKASFEVNLQTQADWQGALTDGRITPVTTPYPALSAHYGTLGTDFTYVTPGLMALDNTQSGGLGDGLLMYWGNAGSDLPQVATWQYTYPKDPNLIGTTLSITVTPPGAPGGASPILNVSLTLNDAANGWVSWAWPVGGVGGLAVGVPTTITIDPVTLAVTPAVPQVGPGFNPANATTIQADELAVGAIQWNPFPAVPVVGGQKPWNYWGQLQVVPEPSTYLAGLGALGMLGMAFWRSRK